MSMDAQENTEEQKEPVSPQTDDMPLEQEQTTTEKEEISIEEQLMRMRETAMRTAAEYDNYRKRVAREKEDIARYANQRLLEEILAPLDNFDMGMQAAKNDQSSMIYIGMSMVQKQFGDFLSSQGVTEIQAEGKIFDHNVHEAVMREAVSEDIPEGKILRVIRRGYMLKDRLLRPANVVVAYHEKTTTEEADTTSEKAE